MSVRPNPPTVFGSSSSCERAKQGAWGILESLVIDHLYNEWMTERWLQSWDIKGCTTFQTTGACGRFRATEEEPDESSSHGPIHTPAATCGVSLCRESRVRDFRVHRLVLEAYVGPCPKGLEGCHFDDNKTNNHLSNLEWDTPSTNAFDAVRNGRNRNSNKTHCINGHEFTAENTRYRRRRGWLSRECRACERERGRIRRQRNPLAEAT